MEIIPQTGTSLMVDNYTIEITRTTNNAVQTARLRNTLEKAAGETNNEALNT
jgi:Mg2+/Co2+ transporter CorB